MFMEFEMKQLISREDKRNPLTDQQLAERLSARREEVTLLRNQLGIPDSRVRRQEQLAADAAAILKAEPGMSVRALTAELQARGYNVSRHVAGQLIELSAGDSGDAPVEQDCFSELIGTERSLRPAIQLAKAAVLYPEGGLDTLITGPSGTGKTQLAELMYKLARQMRTLSGGEFVRFNCAEYHHNPQLLLSQLFGHIRGSFTGATEDKAGLVDKANGGILLLDEVHRLPAEGQEILFTLIDKGLYRRLGETQSERSVKVMLIAATSEPINSSLLISFKRRIPVLIELPALESRPVEERFQLVKLFFQREAQRIGKSLYIPEEVTGALLLANYPGNIGELKSVVKVCCARAFMEHINQGADQVTLNISHIPSQIKQVLSRDNAINELYDNYIHSPLVIKPDPSDAGYLYDGYLYEKIEDTYRSLAAQGQSRHKIVAAIENEVRSNYADYSKGRHNQSAIVDTKLTKIIEAVISEALGSNFLANNALIMCLALHIQGAIARGQSGGAGELFQGVGETKSKYPVEYACAEKILAEVSRETGVSLAQSEADLVTLYLGNASVLKDSARVGILVACHGSVARSMVEVAHGILGITHANYVDMSLQESPVLAYRRVKKELSRLDEGKGVLLMVDMGSLVSFGENIQAETGIKVRTVDKVNTLMLIDAIRWAVMAGAELNTIACSLQGYRSEQVGENSDREAIICTCLTGKGAAAAIQRRLQAVFDGTVQIIPLGGLDFASLQREVRLASKEFVVRYAVGTINPQIPGIPFMDYGEFAERTDDWLRANLLPGGGEKLSDYFSPDAMWLNNGWKTKDEVLFSIAKELETQGRVKQGYYQALVEREKDGATAAFGGIALPHASPNLVTDSVIGLATLAKPVVWGDLEVDIVIVVAMAQLPGTVIRSLNSLITEQSALSFIKQCRDKQALYNFLIKRTQ